MLKAQNNYEYGEHTSDDCRVQRWTGGEDMVIKRQHRKSCDDGVVKNL